MERLTEKIGNTNCVKGCGSNCKYGFQYCSKEDWENCQTIDDVVDKLADYEDLEERLNKVYGDCDGLLMSVVEMLEKHPCIDMANNTLKSRLLTDEDVDKWEEYTQLEEQGRLIKLPCKVGDTVYVNGVLGCGEAERYRVIRVDYHSTLGTGRNEFYIEALLCTDPDSSIAFYDKQFGKTVFLTKSEAEQKLNEMECDLYDD